MQWIPVKSVAVRDIPICRRRDKILMCPENLEAENFRLRAEITRLKDCLRSEYIRYTRLTDKLKSLAEEK